ncbi:hypothetical protein [Marispirochaeta sp.]|uniref:hypothetical protein n=1 Tax=Marispirochaeta sp. TaxID=2038653 RepID=UPI0029C94C69|nr:hypothetical protein [Marispirochaeta sp.]
MEAEISLPAGSSRKELDRAVLRNCGVQTYRILRQSLDARKKPRLFWKYRIVTGVSSIPENPEKFFPVEKRAGRGRAVVVGSGPAGFFAADMLNRSGFAVTLLEQGPPALERRGDILSFEKGGPFKELFQLRFRRGRGGDLFRWKTDKPYQAYFPGTGIYPSALCAVRCAGRDPLDGSSPYWQ